MQLHEARRADLSNKKAVRIGRGPGSGIGKTAGRGIKGATSRSGFALSPSYEGGQMPLFRRLPKRGFRNGAFRTTYVAVNVGDLAAAEFASGATVDRNALREAGLFGGRKDALIKILGDGELTVALNVTAEAFSKSAVEAIKKAGGSVVWTRGQPKKPSPNFRKIDAEKKRAAASAAATAAAAAKPAAAPAK